MMKRFTRCPICGASGRTGNMVREETSKDPWYLKELEDYTQEVHL